MPIPKAIMEAPQLSPGLKYYFDAFMALSSCRPIGMAEGRIPWTAVSQYARDHELSSADLDDLWTLVCALDTVYLKHQQKRSKINETKGKAPEAQPTVTRSPRKR